MSQRYGAIILQHHIFDCYCVQATDNPSVNQTRTPCRYALALESLQERAAWVDALRAAIAAGDQPGALLEPMPTMHQDVSCHCSSGLSSHHGLRPFDGIRHGCSELLRHFSDILVQ